jgi:hypothetical protein
MRAPVRPWGDLAGVVAALWVLFGSGFEDLPAKRVIDAVAVGILLFSAARLALWWRAR